MRRIFILILLVGLTLSSTFAMPENEEKREEELAESLKITGKIDDWQFSPVTKEISIPKKINQHNSSQQVKTSAEKHTEIVYDDKNKQVISGTGQIAGKVTDDEGKPVIANVIIEKIKKGAQSQSNGEYQLINIKPGIYDVRCLAMDYGSQMVAGTQIFADSTTTINFTLSKNAIPLMGVTVTEARNKNIKIDKVSSGNTVRPLNTINKTSLSPQIVIDNQNVGYSVGGAKDIDNFRLNIEEGFLPLPSSITYEGLFYDYYFNTQGITSETKGLFSPSYNFTSQRNPLSDEEDIWLSVGLESNLKESDFERKKLNLVVVLDISGSMKSPFDEYYYDDKKSKSKLKDEEFDKRSKLEIAKETICSMLDHLNEDDRFGMVLFENSAFLAKPLNLVGKTNMVKIKEHIMDLHTQGGTNLYAGMQEGTRLFDDYLKADKTEYENRIIFLTDAMPNRELTNKNSLWGVMDENANKGIYATLIGVGVDFQTLLVEHISKVEGANYYSIHSGKEFRKRLDAEFEYMVTPLVFNLNLVVDTEGYEIMRVCGTPYSEESKGEIMKVGTLFPSPTEEGEVKGGIILVELKQLKKDGTIYLLAGYDDRKGEHFQNRVEVNFCEQLKNSKIITGLQKGVLLVHYADLLKEWTEYTRDPESGERKQQGIDDWQYKISPHKRNSLLNEWEQQSIPLSVDENYKSKFKLYKELLQNATQRFEDETFLQEVELLDFLINFDETEFQYSKQNINRLYGKTPKEAVHYDESPSKINEIPLQYPKFVRDCGIQGTVMLEIEILTDGNVGAVDVLKSVLPGPGGLDEAAVQYARGLKFEPAKTKGKPVAVWIKLPVEFSLD